MILGQHTDSHAGEVVVGNRKDQRLRVQRHPVRRDQTRERDEDDEGRVQPINVLMPVLPRYRLLRDVCTLPQDGSATDAFGRKKSEFS